VTIKELFDLQCQLNRYTGFDDEHFAEAFCGKAAHGSIELAAHELAKIESGQWIDNFLKAMASEMEELRNCTYWKHWCSEAQGGERYKVRDVTSARKEIIDMLHFWINLAQAVGMTPEMVEEMYQAKLIQSIQRQKDGYSIEIKNAAWKMYLEDMPEGEAVVSFEDLSDIQQQVYLSLAKLGA